MPIVAHQRVVLHGERKDLAFPCVIGRGRQQPGEEKDECTAHNCPIIELPYLLCILGKSGAGDGNRTRAASLEGWNSTIELHPQLCSIIAARQRLSTRS